MCGIYAYHGSGDALGQVLEGLKLLEYRGYDSWGVAYVAATTIKNYKAVGTLGSIPKLRKQIKAKATVCLGHTRWATHGGVTLSNAHPHFGTSADFAVVHNGIIENYTTLKTQLIKKGYPFYSETDTEVFAKLLEDTLKTTTTIQSAIIKACAKITGRNTIGILTKTNELYALKMGSPLLIGYGANNTIYLSSDALSLAGKAQSICVVANGQFVKLDKTGATLFDANGKTLNQTLEPLSIKAQTRDLAGFEHYMLKEIYDTPVVLNQVALQDQKALTTFANQVKKATNIFVVGSGTAGVASAQIAYYLRKYANVKATSFVGAEAKELGSITSPTDIVFAPSQSGETADVLEVLELLAEKKRAPLLASYVNMPGTSITRLSKFKFMANAGPEICVMSTKVFTSQIAFGYLLAKTVSVNYTAGIKQLTDTAKKIKAYLDNPQSHKDLTNLAKKLINHKSLYILAKGQNLQIAHETMVKIIEGSYIHAHAIPAGDLKHYAITLMEKGVAVVFLVSNDSDLDAVLNAVHEIQARKASAWLLGKTGVAQPECAGFVKLPDCGETDAILNIVACQLLAYYMARLLNHPIDKPRNIAKSVTVK